MGKERKREKKDQARGMKKEDLDDGNVNAALLGSFSVQWYSPHVGAVRLDQNIIPEGNCTGMIIIC